VPISWLFVTLLSIVVLAAGCAAPISAFLNRDIRTDTASFGTSGPRHIVISSTGERRMVFFSDNRRVCPENFPDASRSFDTKSSIDISGTLPSVDSKELKLKLEDAIKTALITTYTRTEASDIVGRLGAILCVAYLNAALTENEYNALVMKLVADSMEYLKIRARSQGAVTPAPK
jgi:hypothetical protein